MAQAGRLRTCLFFLLALCLSRVHPLTDAAAPKQQKQLRFSKEGQFKILQVADMHFGDGKSTPCLDVLPSQMPGCSDLNTSTFIHRMIQAEKPHLIVFTGIFSSIFFLKLLLAICFAKFVSRMNSRLPTIFSKTPKAF